MYESYWKLKEMPFENTPDPRFLYHSAQHEEALTRMFYTIQYKKGAGILTGVFGCGKTLIAQAILNELSSEKYRYVYINNPLITPEELLRQVVRRLKSVSLPHKKTEFSADYFLELLEKILHDYNREGKEIVIIIDEAHIIEDSKVFEELRRNGHEPVGIRLDSGDLAYLSIQAAKMLDEAGFSEAIIVLSNNLDELVIWQIITQIIGEAPRYGVNADRLIKRLVYGVGTRLITSWGEPALGGVYKLVAVCDENKWIPAIKISESPANVPNPGHKYVWRLYDRRGKATADLLGIEPDDPLSMDKILLRHPTDHSKFRVLDKEDISEFEPLLEDVMIEGQPVSKTTDIEQMRKRREADVSGLDAGVRRIMNPHIYHVSVTERLWELKQDLIANAQIS